MKELYKKLSIVKQEIGKISKDKENPFFKSKYFDINSLLEHLEPILQINKLLLLQPLKEGKVTSVIYDLDSEAFEYSEIQLPELNDPQKLGSAITYYRRYTLQSLLGLQTEDDDGNKASKPTKKSAKPEDDNKGWLNPGGPHWISAVNKGSSLESLRKYYKISRANGEKYLNEVTAKQ